AAGASPKDVVHVFIFRARPRMGDIGKASAAVNSYFAPHNHKPTTTNLAVLRSEEHTSELQSRFDLVCRLLLEKKKNTTLSQMDPSLHLTRPLTARYARRYPLPAYPLATSHPTRLPSPPPHTTHSLHPPPRPLV